MAGNAAQVYRDLGSRQAHERKKHEVTWAATGIALAFVLAGVAVSGIVFRRIA